MAARPQVGKFRTALRMMSGAVLDRYAARRVNFVLAVTRIAVPGAQGAPDDAGNQPRGFAGISRSGAPWLVAFVVALVSSLVHAQAARTVQDGVFSDAQARRGEGLYADQCGLCHGDKLEGSQGPPLTGDFFVSRWSAQPLSDLTNKIRNTMPAGSPGSLTPQQSTDLLAYILKSGGFPAGKTDLASDEAVLSRIGWPKAAVAAAPAPSGPGRAYPPLGNMAQLMRGIFFPNANLIFTVQTHDPAEKPQPAAGGGQTGGFSFVEWGAGIYGGWELVDNAAIALADASPLMLTPGIRCENGRLAPVNDPDWIKFTEEMIAVARKTYQASQTRKQDAVSEATGDLSDACAACHQAYRDVRVNGRAPDPTDPSAKANRCLAR
jgi:mono/diheme cytochrome c family protein